MKGARLGTDKKSENLATSLIRTHIFSSCWFSLLHAPWLGSRVWQALWIEGGCLLMSSSYFNPASVLCKMTSSGIQLPLVCPQWDSLTAFSPHILPCFSGHQHPHDALFLSEAPYFLIRNRYYFRNHIILKKVHSRVWQTQNDWLTISKPQFHNCWIGVNHVIESLSELWDHIYKELSLAPGIR